MNRKLAAYSKNVKIRIKLAKNKVLDILVNNHDLEISREVDRQIYGFNKLENDYHVHTEVARYDHDLDKLIDNHDNYVHSNVRRKYYFEKNIFINIKFYNTHMMYNKMIP